MKTFTQHTGVVVPFLSDNIDTDQIIPSREMKKVSKYGLAEGLFSGQRYLYNGKEKLGLNPEFILNQASFEKATILLSQKNFGCGSSREHAVWALKEFGFRAIIAESFGTIFRNNCLRNGVLPIVLSSTEIMTIIDLLSGKDDAMQVTIDLENFEVQMPNKLIFRFEIEDYNQEMLINGWDLIDMTLKFKASVDRFIEKDLTQRRWAHLSDNESA
jgi:3-isopropylmalate/(R)-2-methylmalate dehydratase small subunit